MTEFRSTPRQLRNMRIAVVICFGVGVVAGFIAVSAKSAFAAEVAAIAGLGWLIFLYGYLTYVLARTVFGPSGISGRGLGGRYAYRWEQIGNVARRAYTSRGVTTYTIILTTVDGDRIRLGAPVSGGIVGDPAFDSKYAQIRAAWQAATGRTGSEADTKPIWTRGLVLLTAGITVQLVAAAVIAVTLSTYGPALAAHEGRGIRGEFQSEIQNCQQPGCTWFGLFTAAVGNASCSQFGCTWSGGDSKSATLAPGGPLITQPDDIVPAVDTGAQYTVYPVGGGTDWKAPAAGLAAAGAVVLVVLAAEIAVPLHLHRRRRRRARAGLAGLS